MAIIKSDEMCLLKAASIKLADDIGLIYTLQYHTEKGDRSKSKYRWLGRVVKISELKNEVIEFKKPENRMNPWMWWNDPTWTGKILSKDSTLGAAADFFRMKLKKMQSWEDGLKTLNGYNKKKSLEEKVEVYEDVKMYDTEDVNVEGGGTVSLKDREALLKLVNKNLYKDVVKKSKKVVVQATSPATNQPNNNVEDQPTTNESLETSQTESAVSEPAAVVA